MGGDYKIVFVSDFDDVQEALDYLKKRTDVLIRFNDASSAMRQRAVDYFSAATYVLGATLVERDNGGYSLTFSQDLQSSAAPQQSKSPVYSTGRINYQNGDVYSGSLVDGKRDGNGRGTMEYVIGDKYVGEWKNFKYHGKGTMFYADGGKFVGSFVNGQYDGYGTKYSADGTVEEARYENGSLAANCYFTVTFSDGEKWNMKNENGHTSRLED